MKYIRRFGYAFMGISFLMRKDTNFSAHLIMGSAVVLFGLFLGLDRTEWLFVSSAIFSVLASEALNTAIEAVVDLTTEKYHPLAKTAKDVGAAGVLLASIYAVLVGLIVFIPHIF